MLQPEIVHEYSAQLGSIPTVSIIIPAYNVARFIGETLDSVFAQTFAGYEVIVVNDGSPDSDELESELEKYQSRIHYFKQDNRGAGAARNAGLLAARGEFVAFLDADDLWQPTYLSEQVEFIRKGDYDLVYADALIFGQSPLAGRTFMETTPSNGEVTFLSLINGDCNVITSGVVARRASILEVGMFDEEIWNSQDFELWARLVRNGARAAYQRRVLLRYRCHENSLSGDTINRIKRELFVLGKIENTYELTPVERVKVAEAIATVGANLELETGKMHLVNRRYAEARKAFRKVNLTLPSLKLKTALWLLRVSPGLLRRLYVRRSAGTSERLG